MEEDTTTSAPVDDGGVSTIQGIPVDTDGNAIPQPETTETAPAEPEATATVEQEPIATKAEPSEEDEQLTKFAESKGLQLDSENAKKAAKMAMNAERAMHEKAQKASELAKAAQISDEQVPTGASQEERDTFRVRNLELKFEAQQWKQLNPDKAQYEEAMVKVLEDPTKRALVQEGYISLDDVYSIARGSDLGAVKSEARKETLTELAQKQQAAVPTGNAVTSTGGQTEKISPQNVERLVAQNDQKWFEANYEAINQAMAG